MRTAVDQSGEGAGPVIVFSHPRWWRDHVNELVDALTSPRAPERDAPDAGERYEVVIADPGWWLHHIDE